jgi:hypothetical protein
MIQIILIWLFVLLLFVTDLFGQTAKTTGLAAAAAEVLQLEEMGRQKTLRADPTWDDLISDGAYMIGPDGNVIIYKAGSGFPPFPLKSFTLSEMIARPFNELVVVTGLGEVEAIAPDKRVIPFKMRFMNVWKKFPDGWKMIVTQRTTVAEVKSKATTAKEASN